VKALQDTRRPEKPQPEDDRLQALGREVKADAVIRSGTYRAETVVPEGGE